MQLLVLVLLLLTASKNADLKQLKPILEEFGGNDAAQAIKTAEELSGVISAVQGLTSQPQAAEKPDGNEGERLNEKGGKCLNKGYPLAPISALADDKITYALSRYVALGE